MATSIAVASGKGGVGKTSMSVNLSLTFAQMNKKTTLLDADFGMANAHILLGVKPNYFIRPISSYCVVLVVTIKYRMVCY